MCFYVCCLFILEIIKNANQFGIDVGKVTINWGKIIKRSRINRIAMGSGSDPQEIRDLLKQYNQSKKMMANMGGNRRAQQRMMKQFGKGDMKL